MVSWQVKEKKLTNWYLKMKDQVKNYYYITIVLVLLAGGIGYWAGTKHSSSTPSVATTTTGRGGNFGGGNFGGGFSGGFPGRGGAGGGFTAGQVVSVSGNTLTIQTMSGSTATVNISGSTIISKTVTGAASDLAAGQTVSVSGNADSSGAISATTIQIRPTSDATPPAQTN